MARNLRSDAMNCEKNTVVLKTGGAGPHAWPGGVGSGGASGENSIKPRDRVSPGAALEKGNELGMCIVEH